MYYGSYKAPREVLWIIGVLIFIVMMATAFMGYSLPWGQMSFWGVTVITNLFSSLDSIWKGLGTTIVEWLWGGYSVSGTTLNRFFSLHYLLPFVLAGLVGLHLWALHIVGQNSPTGLDIKTSSDAVPMSPYATSKDAVGMFLFLILFAWFTFFLPDYLGHADNYIEANPLVTPPTSCLNGTSCRSTRSCAPSPRSCSASSPCSRPLPSSCSRRGSTPAAYARPSTGRSTAGSSGCSYSVP
jgi:ubiquinol-cytochrome c reductase cytochrome b subunit